MLEIRRIHESTNTSRVGFLLIFIFFILPIVFICSMGRWDSGAGLIKIRGDKVWKDLTAMDYHYETQPLPNPVSYFLHQAPEKLHR